MSELPNQIIEKQSQLQQNLDIIYSKIVSPEKAIYQCHNWQKDGATVAVYDCVFDLPTYKHKEYMLAIKRYSSYSIVRLDTDEYVKSKKGPNKPYITLEDRQKETAHSNWVDLITTKSNGSNDWIRYYKPDLIFKSTTSGEKLISELSEIENLIKACNLQTQIIILDENCEFVERSEALSKAIDYDNTKFDEGRMSGSIIVKNITDGFIKDNQSNLTCDIPEIEFKDVNSPISFSAKTPNI